MGTFRIKLETLDTITPGFTPDGFENDKWGGVDEVAGGGVNYITNQNQLPDLLNRSYINNSIFGDFVIEVPYRALTISEAILHFTTLGSSIVLDGFENPVAFNQLPVGFTATSASVKCKITNTGLSGVNTLFLQKDSSTEDSGTIMANDTVVNVEFPYDFSGTPPTMLNIISNGCGLRLSVDLLGNTYNDLLELYIEGTYSGPSPFIWYYNPITNNYQYSISAPGTPWLPHNPTINTVSVNPVFGSTLGGD